MMYMRIVRVQPPEGQADELARRWHRAGEPVGIAETYSEWPSRPHPPPSRCLGTTTTMRVVIMSPHSHHRLHKRCRARTASGPSS
jgi:hypothetical protein